MSSFTSKLKQQSKKSPSVETPVLSRKERLAQKRKDREAFNKLIRTILSSIFLGVLLGLPLGFTVSPKVGIGTALVIPSLIFSYQYPRQALWAFLIYMPFNGTATYWIGGGNILFQISKDAFYLPALLGLAQNCRRDRKPIFIPKQLIPALLILLVSTLLTFIIVNGTEQFLPLCDSLPDLTLRDASGAVMIDPKTNLPIGVPCKSGIPLLQGLLGIKVLIGYIPLIFCAYYLIKNKKQLLFLGRLLLVLTIICCFLGLVQYLMLKTGRCVGNRGAIGEDNYIAILENKCLVGGALLYSPEYGQIRLPGTFVSPWHWGWFLISNIVIAFTVAFFDSSRLWRTGGIAGMAIVFLNSVICGQRAALFMVPIMFVILLLVTGQVANVKRFIPIGILLGLIIGIWVINNPSLVQERIDSFVERWNASPPTQFIQYQLEWATKYTKGLFGRGLGKATNSARIFGDTTLVETFYSKLIFEIGWLGTVAFLIFVTALAFLSFKYYRSVRDPILRGIGSSLWVFILMISYMPYWYPLDTDPVNVYYWFFAGVIFKLPIIDKQEQEKLKEESEDSSVGKKKVPFVTRRRSRLA